MTHRRSAGGNAPLTVDEAAPPQGGLAGVDTDISAFEVEGVSTGEGVAGSSSSPNETPTDASGPDASLPSAPDPEALEAPISVEELTEALGPQVYAKRQADRETAQAALNVKARHDRALAAQGRAVGLAATYVNAQAALLVEMTAVEERVGQLRSLRTELEAIRSQCWAVGLVAKVPDPMDARQIRDNKLRQQFERFRLAALATARV